MSDILVRPNFALMANDALLKYLITFCLSGTSEMTFYVLDIVYDDFALLYSCRNVDNTRKQSKDNILSVFALLFFIRYFRYLVHVDKKNNKVM